MSEQRFLLDTCVVLFALEGVALQSEADQKIQQASKSDCLFLSPVSAWEIGKLVAVNKLKLPIEPLAYFETFAATQGVSICDLTSEIMVRSSFLPELDHRDPMDCILIATARVNNYTIVTRDHAILAYGRQGHVKTLAC
jgi:PIN domain nuclease of toxin-antitoxin system